MARSDVFPDPTRIVTFVAAVTALQTARPMLHHVSLEGTKTGAAVTTLRATVDFHVHPKG